MTNHTPYFPHNRDNYSIKKFLRAVDDMKNSEYLSHYQDPTSFDLDKQYYIKGRKNRPIFYILVDYGDDCLSEDFLVMLDGEDVHTIKDKFEKISKVLEKKELEQKLKSLESQLTNVKSKLDKYATSTDSEKNDKLPCKPRNPNFPPGEADWI